MRRVIVKTNNKFSRGNLDKYWASDYFTVVKEKYSFMYFSGQQEEGF